MKLARWWAVWVALLGVAPAVAAPVVSALPARASVAGIRHEYQRLNNCGPVTVGMALSRWGSPLNQYDIAPRLKKGAHDVNVSPHELAAYARTQGFDTHLSQNGSRKLLKRFLAAGIPVIVETWFITPGSGGMGHYRLLTGYDDRRQAFAALDSYLGRVSLPYGPFDEHWRAYHRTYLTVTPPGRRAEVKALLGFRLNPLTRKREALRVALVETQKKGDALAWLNLGDAKLALGDSRGAARAYDLALRARPDLGLDPTRPRWVTGGLPWRTLWYTPRPFEAYTRTGRYADVLRLTGAVLRNVPAHEEALLWRERALAGLKR